MLKPSVFIGSSNEGLSVAKDIYNQLRDIAEINIWDEGIFGLGQGTLESLVIALDNFDFAILVLTPDDVVESRNQVSQSPRDNVLFECGLFMGRLGRDRTFIVYDKNDKIKLPSDLAGVTLAPFEGGSQMEDLENAISQACNPIRQKIMSNGVFSLRKVSGIEIGAYPFKDIFGKDVFSPDEFHIVYAQLELRPLRTKNNKPDSHPFRKPGELKTGGHFSIERPISSSEVRAAKYLTATIGKEAKTAPILSSDFELRGRLDLSFVALGGPLSNYKTRDVNDNMGNHLLKFDNFEFKIIEGGGILKLKPGFDYGLILKIFPNQFPERTWFICAGRGEWGTSGTAWYLANKWRDIQNELGDKSFAYIIRVKPGQDESAEPVSAYFIDEDKRLKVREF